MCMYARMYCISEHTYSCTRWFRCVVTTLTDSGIIMYVLALLHARCGVSKTMHIFAFSMNAQAHLVDRDVTVVQLTTCILLCPVPYSLAVIWKR